MIVKILAASALAAASLALAPVAQATDDCWGGNIVTPFGSYCDSLPFPGSNPPIHRHCEYVLGWGSCTWRYGDNTLAPEPWTSLTPDPGFAT